jgi:hypothetical protein
MFPSVSSTRLNNSDCTETTQGCDSQTAAGIGTSTTARLVEGWRGEWRTPDVLTGCCETRLDFSSADRTNRCETKHGTFRYHSTPPPPPFTPTEWLPGLPKIHRDLLPKADVTRVKSRLPFVLDFILSGVIEFPSDELRYADLDRLGHLLSSSYLTLQSLNFVLK